jgi:hypothetical protein
MMALDAIFIAFAASVGSTFSALEMDLFDIFELGLFELGLDMFELGRLLDTATEAGKSEPDVTLTAFVITVVLRGSLASVIVPSVSTYKTVGTPDTGFCSANGVVLYVDASILIILALRPWVPQSFFQIGM